MPKIDWYRLTLVPAMLLASSVASAIAPIPVCARVTVQAILKWTTLNAVRSISAD